MQLTRERTNCKGWLVFPTVEEASTGLKDVSHRKMMGMPSWREHKHVVLTYLNSIVFAAPSGRRDLVIQRKEQHRKTNQQGFNSRKFKKEMTYKVDTETALPKGLHRKPLITVISILSLLLLLLLS